MVIEESELTAQTALLFPQHLRRLVSRCCISSQWPDTIQIIEISFQLEREVYLEGLILYHLTDGVHSSQQIQLINNLRKSV